MALHGWISRRVWRAGEVVPDRLAGRGLWRAGEVVPGRRRARRRDGVLFVDAAGAGEDGAQLLLGLLVGVEVLLARLQLLLPPAIDDCTLLNQGK